MKSRTAIAIAGVAAAAIAVIGVSRSYLGGDPPDQRTTASPGDPGAGGDRPIQDRPTLPELGRDVPGPGPLRLTGTVFDASGTPVSGAEITAEFELGPGTRSLAAGARATPPAGDAGAPVARVPGGPGAAPAHAPGDPGAAPVARAPDDSGAPVARAPDDGGAPVARAPGDGGAAPAAPAEIRSTPVIVATSGEDGAFTLIGLVAGRYRLRVEGSDIFTSEVRFFDVPADGLRLIVARKVAVRGTVVDSAGAPVADVPVYVAGETLGAPLSGASGPDGSFGFDDLQEGTFQVWAARGEQAARAVRVARLGAGPHPPVELRLEPAAVVTGRVIDRADGQPLVAAVSLTATSADEPTRFTRSDADGAFRVEGVPPGRWSATAFAPGYIATEAIDFAVGGAFAPVVELTRGAIVAGRVVDGRGVPVAGAVVSARGVTGDGQLLVVSEASHARAARRAAGGRDLIAAAGDGAPPGSDPTAIPPGGTPAGGNRFLPRGELGVLLGPIPFPPPRGAAALRIARTLESGAGGPALVDVPAHPEVAPHFVTDDQGRFRLTGLAAATYRVLVSHPAFADGASPPVAARPGAVRDNLEIVLFPGVVLVGEVKNDRGELIVGATLIADPVDTRPVGRKTGSTSGRRASPLPGRPMTRADRLAVLYADQVRLQAVTGTDGRYRLGPIARTVNVRVTAVRHGDVERRIELAGLRPLGGPDVGPGAASLAERTEDFVLPSSDARLSGRVVDGVGFPVRGAIVAIDSDDRGARGRQATTDEHGRFQIDALPPGRHALTVTHADFPPGRARGHTEAELAIELPFGGGIAGRVRDHHTGAALVGASISAVARASGKGPGSAGADKRDAASSGDGRVELVPLRAGTWTLTVAAPGYVSQTRAIEVPAGRQPRAITVRDVEFDLTRGATVAGTVRDPSGVRVRGAVIRVGERQTRSDENGAFSLRDVATGDPVVISAERDGAKGTLSISLGPGDEFVTLEIQIGEHR